MMRQTFAALFLQTLNNVLNPERKIYETVTEPERDMPDCKQNLASSPALSMPHHLPCQDVFPTFREDDAKHIVEALGPMPREALTAMFDCGLGDAEISRYLRLSTAVTVP